MYLFLETINDINKNTKAEQTVITTTLKVKLQLQCV